MELLIVIVIIGLLAAILIPTIRAALNNARRARMALEISQLESAIEAYQTQNGGEYPPDFSGPDYTAIATRVSSHLRRAFPRNTLTINGTTWSKNPMTGIGRLGSYFADLDPSEALVFWLSQLMNNSQNPLNPTDSSGNLVGQPKVYFNFDQGRLRDKDGDGWPEYYARDSDASPYVYFEFHTYGAVNASNNMRANPDARYPYATHGPTDPTTNGVRGVARPYANNIGNSSTTGIITWVNARKFQIICAGLDGDYGADSYNASNNSSIKLFPSSVNYTTEDRDNLANFSEGRTLENNRP